MAHSGEGEPRKPTEQHRRTSSPWKSRIMTGLTIAMLSIFPEQKTDSSAGDEETPDWVIPRSDNENLTAPEMFAQRSAPFRMLPRQMELARSAGSRSYYRTDGSIDAKEFYRVIGLDQINPVLNVQRLDQVRDLEKLDDLDYYTKKVVFRYVRFPNAPEQIVTSADMGAYIEAVLQFVEVIETTEESVNDSFLADRPERLKELRMSYVNDIVEAQLNDLEQKVPLIVDGPKQFLRLMSVNKALTGLNVEFQFTNLPHVVDSATLPKILELLQAAAQNLDTYQPLNHSRLLSEYVMNLEFSPDEYQLVIAPETFDQVATTVSLLRQYSTKVQGPVDMNFGLGVAYLAHCEIKGPEFIPGNEKAIVDWWQELREFEKDRLQLGAEHYIFGGTGNYGDESRLTYHGVGLNRASRILSKKYWVDADVDAIAPTFSETNLERYLEFEDNLLAVVDRHNEQVDADESRTRKKIDRADWLQIQMPLLFNHPAIQQDLIGDGITADNFKEVYERIREINDPQIAYRVGEVLYIPGQRQPFSIPFKKSAEQPGEISAERMLEHPGTTNLLDRIMSHPDSRIVGLSPQWSADTYRTIVEQYRRFRSSNNGLLSFLSHQMVQQAEFSSEEIKPKSMTELQELFERWTNPDVWGKDAYFSRARDLEGRLIKEVDLSEFPVFSAHHTALDDLKNIKPRELRLRLLERADFSDVVFECTSHTAADVAAQYQALHVVFGFGVANSYRDQLSFPDFPTSITEQDLTEVAAVLTILQNTGGQDFAQFYAQRIMPEIQLKIQYAPVITDDNFEVEFSKNILERYNLLRIDYSTTPEIRVTLPPAPDTFNDMLTTLMRLDMIGTINREVGKELTQQYTAQIDWGKISLDVDLLDIQRVEQMRDQVNTALSATGGDKILIAIGTRAIDQEPITQENLSAKIEFATTYLQADQYTDLDRDVLPLYQLLGNFQVSQILDFLIEHSDDDEEADTIITRLKEAGAEIDEQQGSWQKAWRSRSQPGYVITKAWRKTFPNKELVRPEYRDVQLELRPRPEPIEPHYTFADVMNNGESIATIVLGDAQAGARADFVVRVGGGLTEETLQDLYRDDDMVARAVGSYTTGALKPAELAIDGGEVQNYLISNREAVVLIDSQGRITIRHRDKLTTTDLDPQAEARPLQFRTRVADFYQLIEIARKQEMDVMASHLLVDEGSLAVGENADAAVDKRRLLITMPDGQFGILDLTDPMTLYEAAVLAQALGADYAVNLDTGYYDQAFVYPEDGERIALGDTDKDGTNNVIVLLKPDARLAATTNVVPGPAAEGDSAATGDRGI